MNGIRVRWTRRREENMEAYLTFDQARDRFGLGGTPDNLVRKRISQVATQGEIQIAAENLGDPRRLTWGAQQIVRMDIAETDKMPEHGRPPADVPRAKLQGLIDAINREGGWHDTDTVGELLTQFLDAEGFTVQPSPADRVLDGMRSAHGDGLEWLGLTNVAEYAGMQTAQAKTVLDRLVIDGRVERRGLQGGIYRLAPG